MIYLGNKVIDALRIGEKKVSAFYVGNDLSYGPTDCICLKNVSIVRAIVTVTVNDNYYYCEYKSGSNPWTQVSGGPTLLTVDNGGLYFRGRCTGTPSVIVSGVDINSNSPVEVFGNINAMYDYTDSDLGESFICQYGKVVPAFKGQIVYADKLKLPSTTLWDHCYSTMFNGCSNLISAPKLPATTVALSCYSFMFKGCTSLMTAPELPATTFLTYSGAADGCYSSMFQDCTALTTAPELPSIVLTDRCYEYMFKGCTSLVNSPSVLPTEESLPDYAYYGMFQNCTSLTTSPVIMAKIISASQSFGVMNYMFDGCSSLTNITCLIESKSGAQTTDWVRDVANDGTFIKSPNVTTTWWTRGNSGIPSGWTVVDADI